MAEIDSWSERVSVVLGLNPGPFTGPGTNTYLIGTGRERILLDTGDGRDEYLPVLEQALARDGGITIQEIVLTHGHPDHIGGAASVIERFGRVRVSKRPWPEFDSHHAVQCHQSMGMLVEHRLNCFFKHGLSPAIINCF